MTKRILMLMAIFSFQSLFAFSIGKKGEPFVADGVKWQTMAYADRDIGFEASLPGDPHTRLSNGDVFAISKYEDVYYMISCKLATRYSPPPRAELFLQQVKEANREDNPLDVRLVDLKKPNVKYAVEIVFEDAVFLMLASKNQIYISSVQGEDFSLAPHFFESIVITK